MHRSSKTVINSTFIVAASITLALPAVAATTFSHLVKPGYLTVAYSQDMPGTGKDALSGKATGYDFDVLRVIAKDLGLKLNPVEMKFSGEIASVTSHRVDVMAGSVGWTKQRAGEMIMSDPILYMYNGVMSRKGWDTLKSLEGKTVGSITGFDFIPELQRIPNINLKLYNSNASAIHDMVNRRTQAVVGDPTVSAYDVLNHPSWHMQFKSFAHYHAKFPTLTGVVPEVFAFNQAESNLVKAANKTITQMWDTCSLPKMGAKYGYPIAWYTVTRKNPRIGVDRPGDYKAPSCK